MGYSLPQNVNAVSASTSPDTDTVAISKGPPGGSPGVFAHSLQGAPQIDADHGFPPEFAVEDVAVGLLSMVFLPPGVLVVRELPRANT